jgi:hypothetical protein
VLGLLELDVLAAMHARVPGEELLDTPSHGGQRVGGRGVVQVEIRSLLTIDAGDREVISNECHQPVEHPLEAAALPLDLWW